MKTVTKTPIKYEITCTYCGAITQFDLADIKESSYGARYITCPECNEKLQTHFNSFAKPVLNSHVRVIYEEDTAEEADKALEKQTSCDRCMFLDESMDMAPCSCCARGWEDLYMDNPKQ